MTLAWMILDDYFSFDPLLLSKWLCDKYNNSRPFFLKPSDSVKEKREEEMKKLRQSLNFKATPLPAFYQGQTKSKRYLAKVKFSLFI